MRISDWSSDVCSSDLPPGRTGHSRRCRRVRLLARVAHRRPAALRHPAQRHPLPLARAQCRGDLQTRTHHDAAWQAAGMSALAAETRKGSSQQAAGAGLLAAFVGLASSFAVVIQALLGLGPYQAEAASGLLDLSER